MTFGFGGEIVGAIDAVDVFRRRGEDGAQQLRRRVETLREAARIAQRIVERAQQRFVAQRQWPGGMEVWRAASLQPAFDVSAFTGLSCFGRGFAGGTPAVRCGAAEVDAPVFRFVRQEGDELARALAFCAPPLAGFAFCERGGFDGDETAHHRFADAQPRGEKRMRVVQQCVTACNVSRRAEEHVQALQECLRDAPEGDRRGGGDGGGGGLHVRR